MELCDKMQLPLNDNLKKQGILDISKIDNNLVILTNNEREFQIKLKKGQTPEDIGELLETELNESLGHKLTQYIVIFICKPENWVIINTSEAELKQKQKAEADRYKPKHHFDTFEQWQIAVESA